MKFSSLPMVQAVVQWEKHEKMNNLYVKRMQSVPCFLYSQREVQLSKMGVRQTQAYTNGFQTLQFELYWCQKEKGSANQMLHICRPTNQMANFHWLIRYDSA